ncbi:tetratricopeptide repeat protein, partial [bacterium]|nr:tetratricopeptide repeat protein [bacterium]
AGAAFRGAVAARPGLAHAHLRLGSYYYFMARYEEAADCYRRVVALTPSHYEGYNHLGAVLFELEDYDGAQAMFEKSLALEPTYDAYTNLGSLYFYRHRYADAVNMFRRSLAIDGDQYAVWGYLGESLYWAPGLRDSSRTAYGEAIRLATAQQADNLDDTYLISDLASYHAHLGQSEQSLALSAQLEEKEDVIAEVMFIIADAYEQMGRREKALDWLERACAADLSLAKIELYPGLRELRTHPRYRDMVARRGG